jgi:hypothetical protein
VALGDGGRVLLHCFASCSFTAIIAALGLERPVAPQRPQRPRPPAAMAEARQNILREARRQAWGRPDVLLTYAGADLVRELRHQAERVRERATAGAPENAAT